MAAKQSLRFPGDSDAYRKARAELLQAELDLNRRVEAVAELRRKLPHGGELPTDYGFEEGATDLEDRDTVRPVRLSQLFDGKDTLVLYSFMYGPDMKQPCPMCTSFLDALDGNAVHVRQRVALAVAAKSPIKRIREFARTRPWNELRLVSTANTTYNRDYYGESADGAQMPMMNVFVRQGGKIHHFWGSEVLYADSEDGRDTRHIDMMWPLWNVLDVTPGGRGTDWYPKLAY